MWQIALIASTALSAYSQIQQGKAQAKQYALQAEDARQREKDNQLARLMELNNSLAQTTTTFSALGVDPFRSGSVLNLQNTSVQNFLIEKGTSSARTQRQVSLLNNAATNAIYTSRLGALSTIAKGSYQYYRT